MQLPPVTTLLLLLSNGLCHSEDSPGVVNMSSQLLSTISTASVTAPDTTSATNLVSQPTTETPPKGTINKESSKVTLTPAIASLTPHKSDDVTTLGVTNNEVSTTEATVSNLPLPNATSTLPSSNKTENQNSTKTTETSVNTQPPGTSPEVSVSPSRTITTPKNMSPFQADTEDGKNITTPPTTPSYSSIILPVVIALIVITLLVFTLVGLYRMCWKRDPGTPENGNDQPQSNKESVKLLTVKAISHESGEHSAQGKAKN